MNFIKALYADLSQRIDFMVSALQSKDHHPDIKHRFVTVTIDMLRGLKNDLQRDIRSGVLEFPFMLPNNLLQYNKTHRAFKAIHSYRYLALKNYGDAEIFFFRVISRIYAEHRITSIPPIVSAISNQNDYYWAHPFFEIIGLPAGEEKSLLNLPDMYHEIGHLLYTQYGGRCSETSAGEIEKHFRKEIRRMEAEMAPNLEFYKELLEDVKGYWHDSWVEEFTCDLLGTYMTGAAYGWTNLKLLTVGHGSAKIYEFYDSHPADEARMRIIFLMLQKQGLTEEKQALEEAWQLFLRDTISFKPSEYDLVYPDSLLTRLTDEVYRFFQNADLATLAELNSKKQNSIASLLNEAWAHAQGSPHDYHEFELQKVDELKRGFGL